MYNIPYLNEILIINQYNLKEFSMNLTQSNTFSNKFSLQNFSEMLVYIGIALLAISDSGIQLLILIEIGPGSRSLRLIAMWL